VFGEDGPPHIVDIVAVHDFDETSAASWTYRDNKKIVQLEIERLKGLKPNETRRQSVASPSRPSSQAERGQPVAVETSTAQEATQETQWKRAQESHEDGSHGRQSLEVPDTASNSTATDGHPSPTPSRAASFIEATPGRNWLLDPEMLAKSLPGARVFAFSYPTKSLRRLSNNRTTTGLEGCIQRAASELRNSLETELQKPQDGKAGASATVPIIFVAAGFGGIIVQKAVSLMCGTSEEPPAALDPKSDPSPTDTADGPPQRVSPPLDPSRIADIIFLDTPFPKDVDSAKHSFPLIAWSTRMTFIAKVVRKLENRWRSPGIDKIWAEFRTYLARRDRPIRVAWLYSGALQGTATGRSAPVPKRMPVPDLPGLALVRIPLDALRRLCHFGDSDDPGYRSIIGHMRDSLMLKAAGDVASKQLLKVMLETGAPVNAKDEWGTSLLHLAATAPNPDAINMLLGRHAETQVRNPDAQTPLHCAIEMFCDEDKCPEGDPMQGRLKAVIEQLLSYTKKSELYNSRDSYGHTPQDLVDECYCDPEPEVLCRHDVIQDLLDSHRPTVRGGWEEQNEKPWKGWSQPRHGTPQYKACDRLKASVAGFYPETPDGPLGDYEMPSVYDLIYKPDGGPAKILSKVADRLPPNTEEPCCRWIHLPANNVRQFTNHRHP